MLKRSAKTPVEANAQQLPQVPWFFGGVIKPFQTSLPSKDFGSSILGLIVSTDLIIVKSSFPQFGF